MKPEIFTFATCEGASQRTKNRLREHGPKFMWLQCRSISAMPGTCVLVESMLTNWQGWLPISEITWSE